MSEDKKTEFEQKKIKIFSLMSIAVFLAVLIIPGIMWGIGMLLPGDDFKALDYDLGEKRNKAEFPQQFTSAYGTEIEAYYNDRLPFRSVIITANRKLTAALEKPYDETISPYLVKILYNNNSDEQQVVEDIPDETIKGENEPESELKAETDLKQPEPKEEENVLDSANDGESTAEEELVLEQEKGNEKTEDEDEEEQESKLNDEPAPEKEPEPVFPLNTDDPNYFPPKLLKNTTIVGREGWLFFAKENALEDYVANNIYSDVQLNEYLSKMIQLRDACASQGKRLYYFIPPNKEQVYSEMMPSYKVADEYKRAQRLVDYVHANSDIQIIYPINELRAAKAVCQPYFKTDTHWTEAGAYIGVQALYAMMGMPTIDIQIVTKTTTQYLGGDLLLLGNLNQENYADDIRYHLDYRMDIGVTSVDGTQFVDYVYNTVSTSTNQCKVVLVGDSFRLFMAEYLSKDFSNYTHVHWEHLDDPVAVDAIKNADIIIVESVERLNNFLPQTMDGVRGILQQ